VTTSFPPCASTLHKNGFVLLAASLHRYPENCRPHRSCRFRPHRPFENPPHRCTCTRCATGIIHYATTYFDVDIALWRAPYIDSQIASRGAHPTSKMVVSEAHR